MVPLEPEELPPPLQELTPRAATKSAATSSTLLGTGLFGSLAAKSSSVANRPQTNNAMGYRGNCGIEGIGGNAEFATVPIVTVAVLGFVPSCVTDVGLTLQLSFAGSVPQERLTANVAPCRGETVIVDVPD